MRRKLTVGLVTGLAALAVPMAATPAAAAEYSNSCTVVRATTGGGIANVAYAHVDADWSTRNKMDPVVLLARDNEADGHHVAVRLVTWQADGEVKYWTWRHYYGGNGGQDYWTTSASDSQGIKYAAVQGGLFEGDSLLQSCLSSKTANPVW
ncbi:hypothetical protein [Streptomyces sp. NPDC001652]|uniref:hypothetical protein n=1 Tax=Streptomyces sp. NPDC001652 TaxID=3154393 RepID=UPI0033343899